MVRAARQEVAAARSSVSEKPDVPFGAPPLDLRAVVRVRAHHQRAPLLLHPAEGRNVLVRAEQDPRLARARLRGEVRLPLDHPVRPVGQPARHLGGVAVAHSPLEDREGEAVDLEVDDPGDVRLDPVLRASGESVGDPQRVRVVVVRADDDVEDRGHRRDQQRSDERVEEAADLDRALGHRVRNQQCARIGGQHQQERDRDRVGKANRS